MAPAMDALLARYRLQHLDDAALDAWSLRSADAAIGARMFRQTDSPPDRPGVHGG